MEVNPPKGTDCGEVLSAVKGVKGLVDAINVTDGSGAMMRAAHLAVSKLILDAGIIFVLRHIMIDLFQHKIEPQTLYALSVLLLALGAIRIGSSIVFQREEKDTQGRDRDKSTEIQ